jgi:SAM-dependent methyltransferase
MITGSSPLDSAQSYPRSPGTPSAAAGDFDYERHGHGYAARRRADPRIESQVHAALGSAAAVLNVGAGAGSYEPRDRRVAAVEPSAMMRAQRAADMAPVLCAVAERLPFGDGSFDAAMAMVTVHQWPDARAGLAEMRRVSRGPVVILTFDGDELDRLWLADYVPELVTAERQRFPAIAAIRAALAGRSMVQHVRIPIDCADGFAEAYYARPEQFLDAGIRRAQSAWGFVDPADASRGIERLRGDLESGRWDERYGFLRTQPEFDGALRLIAAWP